MTSRIIVTFKHDTTGEKVRLYIREGVEVAQDKPFNRDEYEIFSIRVKGRGVVTFDENYTSEVKEAKVEEKEDFGSFTPEDEHAQEEVVA